MLTIVLLVVTASAVVQLRTLVRVKALGPISGWLDYASPTGYQDAIISVQGWAVSSTHPHAHIGVRVRFRQFLSGGFGTPRYTVPAATNWRLANTFKDLSGSPWAAHGNDHGFTFAIPAPRGTFEVCVEGNNAGVWHQLSANGLTSCTTTTVPADLDAHDSYHARYYGGAFTHNPASTTNLSYYQPPSMLSGQGVQLGNTVNLGVTAWAGLNSKLSISKRPNPGTGEAITVQMAPLLPTNLGETRQNACLYSGLSKSSLPFNGCTFTTAVVSLNSYPFVTPVTLAAWREVATHEFGHALGFAHPPNINSGTQTDTVMRRVHPGFGVTSAMAPQPFDVASINWLYP
jgi:hypothetical protein